MQALASPASCCSPCSETVNVAVPGPQGPAGADCTPCDDGQNSFTDLAANFTVPDAAVPASATVVNSDWAVVGQVVFLEGAGYFTVTSVPDSTHVVLDNTDYTGNVADGTVIASGSHLGPGGLQGITGAAGAGSGDMLSADNLAVGATGVANASTALTNLGGTTVGKAMFGVANPGAIRFVRVDAANTVTLLSDANMRTALSLVIGTNAQAFDAFLTSIATLGTAADKMIYTTAANVAAEADITSLARTFVGLATAVLQRSALGKVLPRYGLLTEKLSFNVNSAGSDNAITVEASRYRIDRITVDNASINLTLATAGVFTAAGGGGTTVAADQVLSALTATTKFDDLTLDAGVGTDVLTSATIYARCGTAQGAAATCDLRVFGWRYD